MLASTTSEQPVIGFRIARTIRPEATPFHVAPDRPGSAFRRNYLVVGRPGRCRLDAADGNVDLLFCPEETPPRIEVAARSPGLTPYRFTVVDEATGARATICDAVLQLPWKLTFYSRVRVNSSSHGREIIQALAREPALANHEVSEVRLPCAAATEDSVTLVGTTQFHAATGYYVIVCDTPGKLYLALDGQPLGGDVRPRAFNNEIIVPFLDKGEHSLEFLYHNPSGPAELTLEVQHVLGARQIVDLIERRDK